MQEIIIYIALLLVGLVAGFFLAKVASSAKTPSEEQALKAEKAESVPCRNI